MIPHNRTNNHRFSFVLVFLCMCVLHVCYSIYHELLYSLVLYICLLKWKKCNFTSNSNVINQFSNKIQRIVYKIFETLHLLPLSCFTNEHFGSCSWHLSAPPIYRQIPNSRAEFYRRIRRWQARDQVYIDMFITLYHNSYVTFALKIYIVLVAASFDWDARRTIKSYYKMCIFFSKAWLTYFVHFAQI